MKIFIATFFIIAFSIFSANAETMKVKNQAELKSANDRAKQGDIIILKNGNWENISIQLTCNGSPQKPILVKSETRGKVIIKGLSNLRIGGNWIIIDGLTFTEGHAPTGNAWEFKANNQVANNCRITNCLIKSFNNPNRMKENYWVALFGKNNRIDHNNFIDKTNLGVLMAVILEDDKSRLNNHSIDSNYFGYRKPLGSNAGEIIRIGVSEHCTFYSNTKIENNLFEYCDGETEIISIKSCGNVVRNNVFKECQGAVVLRHGNNNTIESNLFLGNGKEGTGGVRVINEGNWIVNNYFSNCKGEGFRSPLAIMNGVFNSPPNRYLPVRDAVIANNTFSNCTPFSICEGSDAERSVTPKNVYIFNNLFYSDKEVVSFEYFDKIDSVYFKGNVMNSKISKTVQQGFEQKSILVSMFSDNPFPSFIEGKSSIELPDSIKMQESKRLKTSFSTNIGCVGLPYFIALSNQSKKLGIQWSLPIEKTIAINTKFEACRDAEALYNYLSKDRPSYQVELTGQSYTFDRPIKLTKNTSIKGNKEEISFNSNQTIGSVFEMSANTQLNITDLYMNATSLKANQLIAADSSGSCIHYGLIIDNSRILNLKNTILLNAFRSSYASHINISRSTFSNNTTLFKLTDEQEKKGYYNVEKMSINRCQFINNKGQILGLNRTGNDESTMGPMLYVNDNIFIDCNNEKELIHLEGVQFSNIANNYFLRSNLSKIALKYSDNVRAKHLQKNNQFTNSGTVTENKYVTNLK